MPKAKISLLDRAKGDLKIAKLNLEHGNNDDVILDIVAYHCSQCAEKLIKYIILQEGNDYTPDHRTEMYLEDLRNDKARKLIESIAEDLDRWSTTIRYAGSIKSSKRAVEKAISVCEELLNLIDEIGKPVPVDIELPPVKSLFEG
ncbi:MAG: HEPN domain-containing protein [Clostridiales bacterium]|jgi:HEPN domain-containing protein|nr:HEPN domain-containing protein [Clostridiales bacterium]